MFWSIPARAAADREKLMPAYVQALLLDMKGDYWGAIDGLGKVMAALPDEPAVRFSISQSYRRLGVPDSAKVYAESALKLDPANPHYLRYLAGLSHELRDYERAAELYGRAAGLEPGRTGLLYLQGLELMSANQPEKAMAVFEKAVTIDPYNEKALTQILQLQVSLKRYPEAVETCKKILEIESGNLKLRMMLGELYAKNGQTELAHATLKGLVESEPAYVPGWTALFDFYIGANRTADFQRELRVFLDSGTVPAEKIDALARLFIARSGKNRQYEGAARELIGALMARRPRDGALFVLKGVFELIHGREREARLNFSKAVDLDSGNAEAWEYLITTHSSMKERQTAYGLIRKARKALPGESLRWKLLEGSLLLQTGSPKKAVEVLEQAVGAGKENSDTPLLVRAHITLALACDALGMKDRSRQAYEMVLRLDPHNTLAMNNLAYMLAEEGIRLNQALFLATNAVMLEPDNGVYLDTLGWVNFKLGQYERARILLERAVGIGVDEAEVYRHLGEVYRKLGNEPKAREMLEKARALEVKSDK
ncbi:MAG: tetratricopeptide repeat protein [Chlorobiaceae bacterium]|nr:tetratricopeptide repeat protein [Chlorobiaceae bacterium]